MPIHQPDTVLTDTHRLNDEDWQAIAAADVLQPVQKAGQEEIALLSPPEQQVLQGISAGHSNKVIAHQLNISSKTVEKHRSNLMRKLEVTSVPDLLRLWFQAYPQDLQLRRQKQNQQKRAS